MSSTMQKKRTRFLPIIVALLYNYFPFDDAVHAKEYPIMRRIAESGRKLPAEADNGVAILGVLNQSNMAWQWPFVSRVKTGPLDAQGLWNAWIMIAPDTASYQLRVQTTAGGSYESKLMDARSRRQQNRVATRRFLFV